MFKCGTQIAIPRPLVKIESRADQNWHSQRQRTDLEGQPKPEEQAQNEKTKEAKSARQY